MPTYPIVGAKFRPPANGILKSLPQNFPLYLYAEPSNQYDEHAIQVYLKSSDIQTNLYDILNEELQGFGKDINDILEQKNWHLGYVPKETAKILKETQVIQNDIEYQVKFSINFNGQPMVEL